VTQPNDNGDETLLIGCLVAVSLFAFALLGSAPLCLWLVRSHVIWIAQMVAGVER